MGVVEYGEGETVDQCISVLLLNVSRMEVFLLTWAQLS